MKNLKFHQSRVNLDHLGLIPGFFLDSDPRPAREQAAERYAHGGGWKPMRGFEFNPETNCLEYPDDEPTRPLAEWMLRDERIVVFEHAWVAIIQPDGTFEVSRMD